MQLYNFYEAHPKLQHLRFDSRSSVYNIGNRGLYKLKELKSLIAAKNGFEIDVKAPLNIRYAITVYSQNGHERRQKGQ